MRDNVVLVAVDQASFHFDKLYSYRLPPSAGEVTRGCRCWCPSAAATASGRASWCARTRRRIPPASSPSPSAGKGTALDGEMVDLALWLKERTFCTVFDAVRAMLPTGLYMRLRPCCAWRRRRKTGWKR